VQTLSRWLMLGCCLLILAVPSLAQEEATEPLIFGMVLVGFRDDNGWSQAHYEAGVYLEETLGATMFLYENYNEASALEFGITLQEIVDDFVRNGVQAIFLTSDAFQDETITVATLYPDVAFIHISGDSVLLGEAPPNVSNLMGQMEWPTFVQGCAAAVTTQTGRIGYLGPLINGETRRLASSAYLGARYCYEQYRPQETTPLIFEVQWVGFWFFIPGFTEDPVALTEALYDNGADVVIAGIDTPVPLEVAYNRFQAGETVFATAYDARKPCIERSEVCLGAAYYDWREVYAEILTSVANGTWQQTWEWRAPDWNHFTDPNGGSIVGFRFGDALTGRGRRQVVEFVSDLRDYGRNEFVPSSFPLWQGYLAYQDGSLLAEDDELVNILDVWYLPQLLAGMQGESFP